MGETVRVMDGFAPANLCKNFFIENPLMTIQQQRMNEASTKAIAANEMTDHPHPARLADFFQNFAFDRWKGGGSVFAMAKMIDDPYLASDKSDTDSVDVYEFQSEVPEGKNQKSSLNKPLKRKWTAMAQSTEEEGKRKKSVFEQMATFNYGLIGMVKKMMDSGEDRMKKKIGRGEEEVPKKNVDWRDNSLKDWEEEDRMDKKSVESSEAGEDGRRPRLDEVEEPDTDTVGWFE
uniref:RRP15-like protein n=1 Tax=Globodera rostochiensis TaxID=31243 RepID=A0A914HV34_GLORO